VRGDRIGSRHDPGPVFQIINRVDHVEVELRMEETGQQVILDRASAFQGKPPGKLLDRDRPGGKRLEIVPGEFDHLRAVELKIRRDVGNDTRVAADHPTHVKYI